MCLAPVPMCCDTIPRRAEHLYAGDVNQSTTNVARDVNQSNNGKSTACYATNTRLWLKGGAVKKRSGANQ